MHNSSSLIPAPGSTSPTDQTAVLQVREFSDHLELTFASTRQRDTVLDWFTVVPPDAYRQESVRFYTQTGSGACKLPAGFAERLRRLTDKAGMPVLWCSCSEEAEVEVPEFKQHLRALTDDGQPLLLDPSQIEACKTLISRKRCALEFQTGGGKTEISLNAWACLREAGLVRRTLFVVPTAALRKQTIARIEARFAEEVGSIGGGSFEVNASVVVGTIQSVCGHDKLRHSDKINLWLMGVDLVIIDEAHHSTSARYHQLFARCPAPRAWALSAKLTYRQEKHALKQMTLEALFGPPAYQGSSAQRTCPTKVIFYHDKSWSGHFDGQRLPARLTDMTPCHFRRDGSAQCEEGFYRGPNRSGEVPQLCRIPCPKDIEQWSPTGEPMYCREAMKLDYEAEPFGEVWYYDPARMVPDRTKFGVHTQGPGGQWIQVMEPHEVIYENLEDHAQMLFEPRNDWALNLATYFASRKEPFVITVQRILHVRLLMKRLKEAGLRVKSFSGSTTEEERAARLEAVRKGELQGLVATRTTISEGIDIPNLVHLIKLDGVGSEQTLTQQLGRVQRICMGKRCGYLHIPVDLQERSLARRSMEMKAYYDAVGVKTREMFLK